MKESSQLSYIGAVELLRAADQITVLSFRFFEPYLFIALIYYVFVMALSFLASKLEKGLAEVIEFHDVHKSFGSNEVLKGINLTVEKGQVVTLIGPSGSGKSTILRCINLLERPTSGKVVVKGLDVTDPKTDIQGLRRDIGMVFQHFNLFPI